MGMLVHGSCCFWGRKVLSVCRSVCIPTGPLLNVFLRLTCGLHASSAHEDWFNVKGIRRETFILSSEAEYSIYNYCILSRTCIGVFADVSSGAVFKHQVFPDRRIPQMTFLLYPSRHASLGIRFLEEELLSERNYISHVQSSLLACFSEFFWEEISRLFGKKTHRFSKFSGK